MSKIIRSKAEGVTVESMEWQWRRGRSFDPDPAQRRMARELYSLVADLPLICPHSHVNSPFFADENATFGMPTEMLILPDLNVFRILYSQWVPLGALGILRLDSGPVERDHRRI